MTVTDGGGGSASVDSITRMTWNNAANPLTVTDALGRETKLSYEVGNDIDVTKVEQKTGASSSDTLLELSYPTTGHTAGKHVPSSVTDAAGYVTEYLYNSDLQVTETKNALYEIESFTYDATTAFLTARKRTTNEREEDEDPKTTATILALDYDAKGRVTEVTYNESTPG